MTLKESMELAGTSLLARLDPEHGYLPSTDGLVSHAVGRWWDAMLRLESATRFPIPGHLEGQMLGNFARLTGNPDRLLLLPKGGLDGQAPVLDLYTLREGLLACWALCRFRSSAWAADLGTEMLKTLERCLTPGGVWEMPRFQYHAHAGLPAPAERYAGEGDMVRSTGRCLEAIVLFHEATGSPPALSLATRLAEYHLEHTTDASGWVPERLKGPERGEESESYLATLSGLLAYGILTGEREPVYRVMRAYSVGLPTLVRESGWIARDLGSPRHRDSAGNPAADLAATAAVAQIALQLATRAGYTDGYADIERMVRSRFLPAQIGPGDGVGDPRSVGGWGPHELPHGGKTASLPMTAAVLHTLSDIWRTICVSSPQSIRVNLHLDYEDGVVAMTHRSAEGEGGTSTTVVRCPDDRNLSIRIPAWAPWDDVRFGVDGQAVAPRRIADYAFFPRARPPGRDRATRAVTVEMPLPPRETEETLPSGERYRLGWKGDAIVWVAPNPGERRFYATRPG